MYAYMTLYMQGPLVKSRPIGERETWHGQGVWGVSPRADDENCTSSTSKIELILFDAEFYADSENLCLTDCSWGGFV